MSGTECLTYPTFPFTTPEDFMTVLRLAILSTAFAGIIGLAGSDRRREEPKPLKNYTGFVQEVEPRHVIDESVTNIGDLKWWRSFRAADGTIFLPHGQEDHRRWPDDRRTHWPRLLENPRAGRACHVCPAGTVLRAGCKVSFARPASIK